MQSLISLVIAVPVILLVLFGALKGRKKGLKRQAIRTASILIALILSILIARLCANSVISALDSKTIADILGMVGMSSKDAAEFLGNMDAATMSYISAIPVAFVISPLIFLIIYTILHFLTIIPASIVSGLLKLKGVVGGKKARLGGMALGAFQGLLVAVIFFAPLTGALNAIDTAFQTMAENENKSESTQDILDTYEQDIKPITNGGMLKFLGATGGNFIYSRLATVSINDASYNMVDDVASPVVKLAMNASALDRVDWIKPSQKDQASINGIIEAFEESEYLTAVFSDALVYMADSYRKGNMSSTSFESPVKEVTDSIFNVLEDLAADAKEGKSELPKNLRTILDAYFILGDYDVLYTLQNDSSQTVNALMRVVETTPDGKKITAMSKVINTLNKNPNTVPIVTALTQVSVAALANQIGADADFIEIYNNVKTDLNRITSLDKEKLPEEEYVAEVSEILDEAITNNNLDIDENVINDMAQYVSDNYDQIFSGSDSDGDGTLSDQEMNNILISYYDVYTQHENNGNIPE